MKFFTKLRVCSFLISLSFGSQAQIPDFNKKCGLKVNTPLEHSGYLYDADCEHVFVLPPSTADLVIEGSSVDVLDLECKPVRQAMKSSKKITALPSFEKIKLQRERRRVEQDLEYSESSLLSLSAKKNKLVITYDRCIKDKRYCNLIKTRITKVEDDISSIELILTSLNKRLVIIDNKLGVTIKSNELDNSNLDELLLASLDRLRSTPGGSLKFSLNNTYSKLVDNFKSLNPRLSIQSLQPNYFLSSAFLGQEGSSSGVIEMHIPSVGVRPVGVELVGTEHTLLGNGLGGILSFSKFVACQHGRNLNSIVNQIQFNAYFVYTSSLNIDYSITYNEKEIFKLVKENTSKTGFFSRKSLSKITRELTKNKSLIMTFNVEDPNSLLNDFDVQTKIKESFLANMVNSEVIRYVSEEDAKSMKIPDLPKENGAKKIGTGISKYCPHIYCQIGGAVLNIASDLFGSTKQAHSIYQEWIEWLRSHLNTIRHSLTTVLQNSN